MWRQYALPGISQTSIYLSLGGSMIFSNGNVDWIWHVHILTMNERNHGIGTIAVELFTEILIFGG